MKALSVASGDCLSAERGADGFACMEVLAGAPAFAPRHRVIVAADIKQRLQVYLFDETSQ